LRGALLSLKPEHRAAILDPKELGGLLRAIEAFHGQPTMTAALKLMALRDSAKVLPFGKQA
jgi:hypothetical protein